MKMRYLALSILLFFCCCGKKPSPVILPPEEFAYAPIYDSVVNCMANRSFNFLFSIEVNKGNIDANRVTCTISGLPANTSMTPASQTVGYVMGGAFSVTVGDVPPGQYPLVFTTTTEKNGAVAHNVMLNILPPPNNAALLADTYPNAFDYCMPPDSIYHYSSVVSAVADTPYLLTISNMKKLGSGFIVRAMVSNIITIPFQTVGAYKIWGSGTYTRDSRTGFTDYYVLTINDTLVKGVDTQRCIVRIQH